MSKPQLKRLVSTLEKLRLDDESIRRADSSAHPKLLSGRRAQQRVIASFFAKAGLDVKQLEQIREQHRTELARILTKQKTAAVKGSPKIKRALESNIASWREGLSQIASDLIANFSVTILDTPVLIWAGKHSSQILVEAHTEPNKSWAKIKISSEKSSSAGPATEAGDRRLSFWYLWQNPNTEYFSVIAVGPFLVVNGDCHAYASGDFLSSIFGNPNWTSLTVNATWSVWQLWNQPQTQIHYQSEGIASLTARNGLNDTSDRKTVSAAYSLGGGSEYIAVPPAAAILIEVAVSSSFGIPDGRIEVDFDSGDFRIGCPFVSISVLSAPL